ncbi:MAG: hypothetical protein RIC55_09310 [Pirellulaceae bacterium]
MSKGFRSVLLEWATVLVVKIERQVFPRFLGRIALTMHRRFLMQATRVALFALSSGLKLSVVFFDD